MSDNQDFIERVDRRDRLVRILEVTLLFVLALFNIFAVIQLNRVINQNQADTVEARKQNIDRQEEIQGYIKCVLLIRYTAPPEDLTTQAGTEKALDKCATSRQ